MDGREDFLTLDVVMPFIRFNNPLPVVFSIEADCLMGGSPGKLIPATAHCRNGEIVLVKPNFRLGTLGNYIYIWKLWVI